MTASVQIREATSTDAALVGRFIRELARYEKLEHDCTGTVDELRESLFGPSPFAKVLLAFIGEGLPAGFAVYFFAFSTFKARPVLYLEDLFVAPELRGQGIGRRLFRELIQIAHREKCARMEWSVLDWNSSAIAFYQRIGATEESSWRKYRLTDDQISSLAVNSFVDEIVPENKNR
jgi:GNAT superfamily N-acetyltransferase